ncbi:Kef-type potassium/proton antiporter, CPA2 family [Thalassoporum mexicanum PCC 7367]|uniref:cation:proton antiporter n=1 Tax=Thalassoporum mexicanum TaxID=3457544 RepID=UPI00029FAFD1|nr:cation:proton antiporter [Pseudanabaena sp. PCC 7367]AFY70901.1 Kef-type potassium/proton antiporter, CPA2 family [Pseudanabaena sp. PCC 7367]
MQEDFRLIVDLVTVLAAASIGGLVAAKLRLPVIIGYLLGGIVVGPTGMGLIKELIQVETLAQFGVAFLLFALGVEFSLGELKKVQAIALGGGSLQIASTIGITAIASTAFGMVTSPVQGIFLGAILSLSSTAVVLRSLMENDETDSAQGQVMLGILIVQDLALGLMLAVLPALDQPADVVAIAVAKAVLVTALFAGAAIAVGIWLIPPLLRMVARTESRELFLLSVIALCLVIALTTEHLGLSIEMGAFVAGLMISEVEYADQTLDYVEPLRDVFATLFFAAIGMLIDPLFLWENKGLIMGLVGIAMLGKFLIVTPLVVLFRYPARVAIAAGLGLAQIGEFSFVLASEGQKLGLVSRQLYLLILGTTAVTLILTPFLLQATPIVFDLLEKIPFMRAWLNKLDIPQEISPSAVLEEHVVVCGYGKVGQNIVGLLQARRYPILVIEQSETKLQMLRDQSIPYIYGNCSSPLILEKADVHHARSMVVSIGDAMNTRLCVQRALSLASELDIVAMAAEDGDIDSLYQLGAAEVVHPEFEASLELSTHLLLKMGESDQAVLNEINSVRSGRYADFRPDIACHLPAPMGPYSLLPEANESNLLITKNKQKKKKLKLGKPELSGDRRKNTTDRLESMPWAKQDQQKSRQVDPNSQPEHKKNQGKLNQASSLQPTQKSTQAAQAKRSQPTKQLQPKPGGSKSNLAEFESSSTH